MSRSETGGKRESIGCYDHNGVWYPSETKRAKAFGKDPKTVKDRLKYMGLKDALTKSNKSNKKQCFDHNGRPFNSIKDMCKFHDIPYSTYMMRKKSGWSDEKSLTTKARVSNQGKCYCHKGLPHDSESAMCRHYNQNYGTYKSRIMNGWSQRDALEIPPDENSNGIKCVDHVGTAHDSIMDMVKIYGTAHDRYCRRIEKNWTVRESLVTPTPKQGGRKATYDTTLNPLIVIHEYRYTFEPLKLRFFRVTILKTGEEKFMCEEQIKVYPDRWKMQ